MTNSFAEITAAVAFAHTAEIRAWRLMATNEERKSIERMLHNLFDLGHIASFAIYPGKSVVQAELVDELRSRLGDLTIDACRAVSTGRAAAPPSFLMPVWAFDHLIDGTPASTSRLLGLDLALIATPSSDEELGVHLPGHVGCWVIHARPLGT